MRQILSSAILGLAIAIVTSSIGCSTPRDIEVSILFDQSEGLEERDDVRISGVRIGSVSAVDVTEDDAVRVRLEIRGEYRNRITEDTKFDIKGESWFSTGAYVAVDPGDGEPVPDKAEFVGEPSPGKQFHDAFAKLRKMADSPETRAALQDLQEKSERAVEDGKNAWEEYQPQFEEKTEEMLEDARRRGEGAWRDMSKELERLKKEMEERTEPIPAGDDPKRVEI